MTAEELNDYLRMHIPLSAHMGMRVVSIEPGRVRVHLPMRPNLNPHGTVFGGALAALGLATGWMLLHASFARAGIGVKLVGQKSECEFLAPASGDCIAESVLAQAEGEEFLQRFRERGKARQAVLTVIRVGEIEAARHTGLYAALHPD